MDTHNQDNKPNQSEVARLLALIDAEYTAGRNGLYGLAHGSARHSFITARMEHMEALHKQLQYFVGDTAIALIVERLDRLQEAETGEAHETANITLNQKDNRYNDESSC